jgi:hypothetical protein
VTSATGSENYISKFGPSGIGLYISQLFDNGTSVGIGTATPAAKLDVAGDALINGLTVGRGVGNYASNTVLGYGALFSNTTGIYNTAVGIASLEMNTTGNDNTAN